MYLEWNTKVYVHAFVMKFKSQKENKDMILHHLKKKNI